MEGYCVSEEMDGAGENGIFFFFPFGRKLDWFACSTDIRHLQRM